MLPSNARAASPTPSGGSKRSKALTTWGALLVCALLLAPMPSFAQMAVAGDVAARVDAVFALYDRDDSPGCSLGVIHDNSLVYARGYGMANLEFQQTLGPTTVFRIGSTSKQFTAAVMAMAEQHGELSLDDDIRLHLPEMPEYEVPVTIRMLLHHTSGIRDYLGLMSLAGLRNNDWYSNDEALDMIARQRETNFTPGTEHLYSNSGYFLISQIIQRATGSTLREYADEHLFQPLGMNNTHFHDDHTEVVVNRASGYAPATSGFDISMTTLDMVGDGGVFTTVEDLARWDRNFYDPSVGGEAFLETMLTRGVLTDGETLDYALGLSHGEYRGVPTVQHGGAFVGFRAEMMRFPEQQVTITVLCNLATTSPTTLARGVADAVLESALAPAEASVSAETAEVSEEEPVELSADQLERWTGMYYSAERGLYFEFEVRGGALTLLQAQGIPLTPTSPTRFILTDAPVSFDFSGDGEDRRLTLHQPAGQRDFVAVVPPNVTAADAAAFAGSYYADELGVEYVVTADGTEIHIKRGRGDPIRLVPTVQDEFTLGGSQVNFERRNGRPVAFVIDAGRVRGIRFERTAP